MPYDTRTLDDYRSLVRTLAQDVEGLVFTTAEVDAALRRALADLRRARPLLERATLTLNADGGEIDLAEYSASLPEMDWENPIVQDLRFTPAGWSDPSPISGYFLERTGDTARLVFFPLAQTPRAGDSLSLRYGLRRTMSGLDGASATRLFPDEAEYLCAAAAGYLARDAGIDRAETIGNALQSFAERTLADWQALLEAWRKGDPTSKTALDAAGWGELWDDDTV